MTIETAITKAYSMAKGKPTPPAVGTTKYNQLLLEADTLTKLWAAEPSIQWNSLYARTSCGTLGAVSSKALDATINYVIKSENDPIYVVNNGARTDLNVVTPDQLYLTRGSNTIALAGRNLIFNEALTADSPLFGGTLYVPSLLYPTDITTASQSIQVDDPMWLVYMMAAEFVRNDLVRQNQYPSLINYAQESMKKMKENNQGSYETVITNWEPLGETWV